MGAVKPRRFVEIVGPAMRTEIWHDCRNVEGGWRCVTEFGEELYVQYRPDYAQRFQTGPARMPDPERGDRLYDWPPLSGPGGMLI